MNQSIMTVALFVLAASAWADAPALKIVAGCEACVLPDNVQAAMRQGYANALGEPGVFAGEVEVTVTEYQARSGAARFVLGVLAGKDKIVATLNQAGQTVAVEDTARSTLCGIECVAANVGGKLAAQVAPDVTKAVRDAQANAGSL